MPPKRMTANPTRPARYRPGKPVGPEEHSSDSESEPESSERESPEPQVAKAPVAPAAIATSSLKSLNLDKRFEDSQKAEAVRLAKEARDAELKKQTQAEGSGGSSDEYTTDESDDESEEEESEEEEAPRRRLIRPTFVSKAQREARGKSVAKKDEEDDWKKLEEEEEKKKKETYDLLDEHLKREAAARLVKKKSGDDEEEGGIDDTDGLDPAAERAAWKLRELKRIKRERDALEAIEKEREEIERRRQMDPALREKEDMEFVKKQKEERLAQRGEMGFMQKFYHKGAFYQDAEILHKRNYATAAVEDGPKNREVLPKYLQARGDEVGKRGRTKHTHLAAEDTTLLAGGDPRSKPRFDRPFDRPQRDNPNHAPLRKRSHSPRRRDDFPKEKKGKWDQEEKLRR